MGNTAAEDMTTDMQTIRDYVDAVVQAQAQFTTAYGAALDNFQLTMQTASPQEATPDILGVVAKSGLKFAEKSAVTAVKDATGADLGPLVEMVQAIYDEADRAAKAATARSAADFVTGLRTAVINGYTQGTGRQAMVEQLQNEYNQNDEGGRGGYIGGVENELEATKTVSVPKVEAIEQALYAGSTRTSIRIAWTGLESSTFNTTLAGRSHPPRSRLQWETRSRAASIKSWALPVPAES